MLYINSDYKSTRTKVKQKVSPGLFDERILFIKKTHFWRNERMKDMLKKVSIDETKKY